MRFVHVQPWLETVTFDILVEAYWAAQARRADDQERQYQRRDGEPQGEPSR